MPKTTCTANAWIIRAEYSVVNLKAIPMVVPQIAQLINA
jgi:hypothetical protein